MHDGELIKAGVLGLLIGDACGVPYEFRSPAALPSREAIEMLPPSGFIRSHPGVCPGTWSDDGAQALCLLDSLLSCDHFHAPDFASRLVRWHDGGYCAVEGNVFDVGNQTSAAISRIKRGMPPGAAGLSGVRNNGNGSLMRCLPLALFHRGPDVNLIVDAHRQSRVTHGHPRAQVCCALYCLWAKRTMQGAPDALEAAIRTLREVYAADPISANELETEILPHGKKTPRGDGYVVDSFWSAVHACRERSFEETVRAAIALGRDTDTTACLAGGIAALRFGYESIPQRWLKQLRGREVLQELRRRHGLEL